MAFAFEDYNGLQYVKVLKCWLLLALFAFYCRGEYQLKNALPLIGLGTERPV